VSENRDTEVGCSWDEQQRDSGEDCSQPAHNQSSPDQYLQQVECRLTQRGNSKRITVGISHFREYRGQAPGLRNPHLWIIIVLFVLLTTISFHPALLQIPGLGDISIPVPLAFTTQFGATPLSHVDAICGLDTGDNRGRRTMAIRRCGDVAPHFPWFPPISEMLCWKVSPVMSLALWPSHLWRPTITTNGNKRNWRKLSRSYELARQNYEEYLPTPAMPSGSTIWREISPWLTKPVRSSPATRFRN
jgi:hypothetical protein